ncbi:amino acid permease [Propionicimonas sp.]|uniref:amino acid permease n=1 Tax=Propionicimonas sp. TaxID=1955623 RepID=UPI0039E50028
MSDPVTQPQHSSAEDADAHVANAGYKQQFTRTLGHFESFAVAFSFISITTGLFSTFGVVLNSSGPAGIWTWPIATIGTVLVALVYGMLASRIPLSGFSYQWASRLANPVVGWWYGWISFAFLLSVTISVDYAFSQVALFPLLGWEYNPLSGAVTTAVVMVLQASLIIWSTPILTRINNAAVGAELIAMIGLTVLITGAIMVGGNGDIGNWTSTGVVSREGYFGWLGPFMMAFLLGAYTLVGWESSANLTEETKNPKQVIPRAMVRSVLVSGIVGTLFLMAISAGIGGDIEAISASTSPVADIIGRTVGHTVEVVMLVVVCVAIFACGLVIMTSNSRLIYAMARDGRIPFAETFTKVPRATGGPIWATVLAAAAAIVITLGFYANSDALAGFLGAGTLMPAILYAATIVLYLAKRHKFTHHPDDFSLGKWEWPVVIGACIWLLVELSILIFPEDFRIAQYYALGTLLVGGVVFAVLWATRRDKLVSEVGQDVDAL